MRRLCQAICGLMAIAVKNPPIIAPITPHDTISCPVRYSPAIGVCTDSHSCEAKPSDRRRFGNHESWRQKRTRKATRVLKRAQRFAHRVIIVPCCGNACIPAETVPACVPDRRSVASRDNALSLTVSQAQKKLPSHADAGIPQTLAPTSVLRERI
jgi:hypothetical protein